MNLNLYLKDFNVITKNINWLHYIKDPSKYLDRNIKKINLKNKLYKKKLLSLSLLLAGNKEITNLNKKFRKKRKSTDVLSFPFQTKNNLKKKLMTEKEIYLGDIIVNLDKIKNKTPQKKFKNEFNSLWIHGLVHLLGYDHKTNKDFVKMTKIEKNYFNIVND